MSYLARDFARVPSILGVRMPNNAEDLIHRQVRGGVCDTDFASERGAPVYVSDIPSDRFSITFSSIAPNTSKRNHRHSYEAITVIEKGSGYSIIEGKEIFWRAGDVFLVPVWAWHQHVNPNKEPVLYLTFENAPELLNYGIAIREEE